MGELDLQSHKITLNIATFSCRCHFGECVCSAFNAQSAMEMIVFLLLLMLFHSRESFSAKMLVLNIKIISVSYAEKHNSLLFTYFFIVPTQLFVYLFIEWLVNYFSPHTQVLCMYLVFCFISPPVDSYLESMAEGKSVFTSTDSPYCTIDQSTDTREQKKPSRQKSLQKKLTTLYLKRNDD